METTAPPSPSLSSPTAHPTRCFCLTCHFTTWCRQRHLGKRTTRSPDAGCRGNWRSRSFHGKHWRLSCDGIPTFVCSQLLHCLIWVKVAGRKCSRHWNLGQGRRNRMFTSVKSGSRKEKLAVNAVITLDQTVALAKFGH